MAGPYEAAMIADLSPQTSAARRSFPAFGSSQAIRTE